MRCSRASVPFLPGLMAAVLIALLASPGIHAALPSLPRSSTTSFRRPLGAEPYLELRTGRAFDFKARRPPPPSQNRWVCPFTSPQSLCRGGSGDDYYSSGGGGGYEGQDAGYGDDPFDSYGREFDGYAEERPVDGGRSFRPSKANLGNIPGLDKVRRERGAKRRYCMSNSSLATR